MVDASKQMVVSFRMVGGMPQTLCLEKSSSCTVLKLQQKIFEELLIPVEFQKILSPSGAILDQTDVLESRKEEVGELTLVQKDILESREERVGELTLVISLDEFCSRLLECNAEELQEACGIILRSSHICRGNSCIITALVARLADPNSEIKCAASQILPQLVERGDECVVAAVTANLNEQDMRVRRVSWEVLQRVADEGDEYVVTLAIARMSLRDKDIRCATLEDLPWIGPQGHQKRANPDLVTAVIARLQDQDRSVRCAALKVLPHVGSNGEDRIISAVIACLGDQEINVRRAALETLNNLAQIGDGHVAAAVVGSLADHHKDIRHVASSVLTRVAEKRDKHVVATLVSQLENRDKEVKCAALRILGLDVIWHILEKGERHIVSAVVACLEDPDKDVRRAALGVIWKVAQRCDRVAAAVACRLAEQNELDFSQLLCSLERIVEEGGESIQSRPWLIHCLAQRDAVMYIRLSQRTGTAGIRPTTVKTQRMRTSKNTGGDERNAALNFVDSFDQWLQSSPQGVRASCQCRECLLERSG
eukprot:gnl/MRDRNA2_/MRDRNA2_66358_c0_seq1.p1 gnl/MRDRNA2_/MRDRNA2_66358_c0~~gnl/MRDRNA2_/MRDRNA2_66358_c0_seq1.p1  ORF type:complete len:569 (+),score=85.70 gnl/MRDRNA2_/MRDRNA2_66358_c0_seq1:94-1707(+)